MGDNKLPKFGNIDLKNISFPDPLAQITKRTYDDVKMHSELIQNAKREKELKEEAWRQQLVELLIGIQRGVGQTNENLDFILNSIGANTQIINREQILTNNLLQELYEIINQKDKPRLDVFMREHGLEAVALLFQVLKLITTGGI